MLSVGPLRAQEDAGRLMVRHLRFDGNHYIDELTLRASIATSRSSAWQRELLLRWLPLPFGSKRYLDETELQRDVVRIILLYRASGFFDVRVDTTVARTPSAVDIRFRIEEGEPVRVTSLTVSGTRGIVDEGRLRRGLPLQAGDPFDRLLFLASADSIRSVLRNQGYPFAEIFRNFDEDRDQHTADVAYDVVTGPRATIDSIEVVGPRDVDESLVRRMLTFRVGEPYSQEELLESQRELYRLGVFDFVDVALVDSVAAGPDDSLVTVRAQVSEGRLNRVRVGAGYGTLDCFRTLTSWTVRDFLGGGRTFDITARLSKIGTGSPFDAGLEESFVCGELKDDDPRRRRLNYNVTGSVRFPYVLSPNNSALFAVSGERRSEVNAFVREAAGANFALTRDTPWDIPITFSYSLLRGRTSADAATFCSLFNLCNADDRARFSRTARLQSTVGVTAVRDRTNSSLNPTRGSRIAAQVRYSSDAIGSDSLAQFFKWSAEIASYHPLNKQTVFAWRVRFGAILSPSLAPAGQQTEAVPIEERFYTGGPTTVRGFRQNELGPVVWVIDTIMPGGPGMPDDTTVVASPTGGNQLFLINAELRFPLPVFSGRLGGAVFVDAGDAFLRDMESLPFRELRVTPGFGVRVYTPLGPIRLDLAYNPHDRGSGQLYRLEGSNVIEVPGQENFSPERGARWRLNFSIGEAF